MQVIVFDKFFHCVYRLRKIPNNWHFDEVAKMLKLEHNPSEYQAFRMDDNAQLCIDDFVYKDGELMLTDSLCND